MVNLIYPAVLGSVLYLTLDFAERKLPPVWTTLVTWQAASIDQAVVVKALLLSATVLFYCCDYMYLRLTREFRITFFIYDLFFLAALYFTVVKLRVRPGEQDAPHALAIAICYFGFLIFYLVWDRAERKYLRAVRSERESTLDERSRTEEVAVIEASTDSVGPDSRRFDLEINLYDEVVLWEVVSLTLVAFTAAAARFVVSGTVASWLLALVLWSSTIWFVRIIWLKAKLHPPYDAPAA